MTLSQAKIEAFAEVETAIEKLVEAFRIEDDPEDVNKGAMLTGWLIVTNEVKLFNPDEIEEGDDEQDLKTIQGAYTRRGQNPLLSMALAHEYIRHWNEAQ
jgi:hypothetical protein